MERIKLFEKGQEAMKALHGINMYLKKSPLEKSLQELVLFRVSQINGCAYCLDMHAKDARAAGETEQRLYGLSAWREAPYYSARERAAFAWAEAVTAALVPDQTYEEARSQFSDQELVDLTVVITTINTYNRLNIAFPNMAAVGTYTVGQWG